MPIERTTQEYRQVKDPVSGFVKTVQQKWLVENGLPYSPADFGPPDSPLDQMIGMIGGRPTWQPFRVVWRDLPIVSEAEACS